MRNFQSTEARYRPLLTKQTRLDSKPRDWLLGYWHTLDGRWWRPDQNGGSGTGKKEGVCIQPSGWGRPCLFQIKSPTRNPGGVTTWTAHWVSFPLSHVNYQSWLKHESNLYGNFICTDFLLSKSPQNIPASNNFTELNLNDCNQNYTHLHSALITVINWCRSAGMIWLLLATRLPSQNDGQGLGRHVRVLSKPGKSTCALKKKKHGTLWPSNFSPRQLSQEKRKHTSTQDLYNNVHSRFIHSPNLETTQTSINNIVVYL